MFSKFQKNIENTKKITLFSMSYINYTFTHTKKKAAPTVSYQNATFKKWKRFCGVAKVCVSLRLRKIGVGRGVWGMMGVALCEGVGF